MAASDFALPFHTVKTWVLCGIWLLPMPHAPCDLFAQECVFVIKQFHDLPHPLGTKPRVKNLHNPVLRLRMVTTPFPRN